MPWFDAAAATRDLGDAACAALSLAPDGGLRLRTMAAWLEEVYSYILKRRLRDGGEAEVSIERE